ncbi:Rha family transcriptional regulator [Crassaminicella thermophila]|uniref:Rha family transcriptional regulator n=1 Tax=Crassaminicella thermophila TaxID=2599308 RepID=A0A5C0SCI8_CRATE|nr:Rha family transcriptional regulator [Crassaminicella thermophila]QEK11657.1 Rha family transcriptional regulator [Crassaminicella thermophila]
MKELITKPATLDSREVAEMVGKRHSDLLRDIETYIQYLENAKLRSQDFFLESTYKAEGNNKTYKRYNVTKKGCEFIAHKLTGQKGAIFTARYINKFHEMEQQLSAPLQQLSPQLQLLINMELEQKKLKADIQETKKELQDMRDVITLDTTSWRTDARNIIVKIAQKLGGFGYIKEVNTEIYTLLDKRMGTNLKQRLTNKRRRMADEGVCKSRRDKLNYLDVIADDKKLIEGYVAITKEMAIKYGVA